MAEVSEGRILAELQDMTDYWHNTIDAKRALQRWYRREYKVTVAESDDVLIQPYEFRSGRYSEIVDRTKGLVLVDPVWSIEAKGIGPRVRADAERAQAWLNHAPAEIELAQGQKFNNDVSAEAINYGYSGLCVLPDPQRWANYPEMGDHLPSDYLKFVREFGEVAPFPIAAWHIPVLSWRPMLSGRLVLKSFQVQEMRVGEIRYRYPDANIPDTKKQTDKYLYVTVIDDTHCHYLLCEGTEDNPGGVIVLKTWEHHMPVPPGTAPVVLYEGLTTGESDIQYRWKGYAEDITGAIQAQDMLVSVQVTRAALSAIPTAVLELDPNMSPAQADKLKDMEFKLFGTNVVVPGAKWQFPDFSQAHPVEEYIYTKMDQLINSRYPPAMRGEIASESGYAFNLSAEYAKLIVKPLAQNLAEGDIDFARLLFLALGALKAMNGGQDVSVPVRATKEDRTEAISVSYGEVESYGPLIRCTREATLPVDEQAQLQAAQMAIDIGLPRAHAWETYAKKENPQELADEAFGEKLLEASPTLMQQRAQAILRRMGALRDAEEGLTADQAAALPGNPPAAQTMLAALGSVPGASIVPQTANARSPGLESAMPQAAQPPLASEGIAIQSQPPKRRRHRSHNPRAGQRSQPSGPHLKPAAVEVGVK